MEVEDLVETKLKALKIPYKRNIKFLCKNNILEIDFLCPNVLIEVKTSFDVNNREHNYQLGRFDNIIPSNFKIIVFTLKGQNKIIKMKNRDVHVFNKLDFISKLEINYDIFFCHHHTILQTLVNDSISPNRKYFTSKKNYEIAEILINKNIYSLDWINTNFNFNNKPIVYYNTIKNPAYRYKRSDISRNKDLFYHLFYFFHKFYQHYDMKGVQFRKPINHNPKYTYKCCNQILWNKIKCKKCCKIDLKLFSISNI